MSVYEAELIQNGVGAAAAALAATGGVDVGALADVELHENAGAFSSL